MVKIKDGVTIQSFAISPKDNRKWLDGRGKRIQHIEEAVMVIARPI